MTRFRRIALTVLVGVLVTLPTVGPALADTADRQSVLGTYSIDENGDTTLTTGFAAGITLPSTTRTGAGPFTTLIALSEDSGQQSNTGEQSEFFV